MKILLVGGNGTIGRYLNTTLSKEHEVIVAGRSKADVIVDITDSESIKAMYEKVDNLDAVICVAGEAKWEVFENLSEEDFYIGIKSKLMGQVNLVRIGKDYLNHRGSFTLTTGILADEPVYMTSSAAMVNGGIHSFVKAVALELGNGLRINAVSSDLVEDAYEKYRSYFPGNIPVPMQKVAMGYIKAIESRLNGQIIRLQG